MHYEVVPRISGLQRVCPLLVHEDMLDVIRVLVLVLPGEDKITRRHRELEALIVFPRRARCPRRCSLSAVTIHGSGRGEAYSPVVVTIHGSGHMERIWVTVTTHGSRNPIARQEGGVLIPSLGIGVCCETWGCR